MIGVRLNTFNDNVAGEQEQDANSALTELDKGLRSNKVGEQCEAIVRFPRLFEKYPFPILINSSFLKLADVFRVGNNFLRLWVLRVCQQSEKHLDKILNVDEFLKRIYSVLHSNDPVARALALRTLGAVAGIIPERQNVHHAIRRGLDSYDDVEVDAAIYATTRFAAHSNAFAVSMCNKISDMVECEHTGPERRAKLVGALCTVHGGAIRAHGVLKLLRSLLERFPSSSSVRATIAALTAIAADTVVHVPDQVELLLKIAVEDPRSSVRRAALAGLRKLAEHAALWPAACVQALVAAACERHDDTAYAIMCLEVMQILVKCPAICAAAGPMQMDSVVETSLLASYCSEAALSPDLRLASTAANVLTHIIVYCYQENLLVDGSDLMLALESIIIATAFPNGQGNIKPLRVALKCLIQLSNANPTNYAQRTASVIGSQLNACKWVNDNDKLEKPNPRLISLLEALGALGGTTYCPHSLQPAMVAIVSKLTEITNIMKNKQDVQPMDIDTINYDKCSSQETEDGTALVLLCTVVCQERAGAALANDITDEWEIQLLDAIRHADGWTRYRVARAALRYGHQQLAASILGELAKAAPSESAQRWLTALHRAAAADALLIKRGINGLEEASSAWERSGGAGGAGAEGGGACAAGCSGCGACTALAAAWMCARAQQLAALARTAQAARALCTQPPPAIAHTQTNREPAVRVGACATALRKAGRALGACAQRYAHIARTAFHADDKQSSLRSSRSAVIMNNHYEVWRVTTGILAPVTFIDELKRKLYGLYSSQHMCNLMSQFIERIITANHQERQVTELSFSGKELKASTLEEKVMLSVCMKIEEISSRLFDDPTTKPGITHRHAEAVLAAVRACSGGALWARGVCAGRTGGARCRVSLSPGARPPPADHAATLPLSHHLTLKLEGVILPATPLSKRQEQREVKGVQLTVTATPHPRTNEKNVELTGATPVLTAVQTVTPVRDFFSAQQLVAVPAAGLYTVAVEAAFIDQRGDMWNTGPRTSIVIKAHEEPSAKGNVQNTRGRF
ncbi:Integrator complex subunit 7 [Eumeta japonica]|uniref:Integrator complex subunit 7 n=1 Tax=Eumeta variegata TaxID=151549 RepID=A0A4C1WM32_EUMVA|nr:Integrator complex subunit 7 [Eumeta japonica]